MEKKTFYSIQDVSQALGVHRNTVGYWIRQKYLSAHKVQRKYMIINAELRQFLGKDVYDAMIAEGGKNGN